MPREEDKSAKNPQQQTSCKAYVYVSISQAIGSSILEEDLALSPEYRTSVVILHQGLGLSR